MDRLSVKWAKKPDSLTELLDRLEAAYDFLGIDGINDQYKALQDYADEHGSVKFVTKDTFKRWMDPHTRGSRKVKKNPAWDIIRDFVDHNQNGEEVTDEVNMPVKSSNDIDKFKMFVPELPSMQVPEGYVEISESSISRVMDDNPTADNVGSLVSSIRRIREEFGLIADHGMTVIPGRVLRHVNNFVAETLKSEEECSTWICEDDKIVQHLVLTDKELLGSGPYKNCPKPQTVDGRKIIGVNIPSEEPAWCSRYSVTLADEPLDKVSHRVFTRIPEELFPDKGETADSMISKISRSKYLDVIYSWFNGFT
eukprot:scaffold197426_cov40-Cyclotella_meneghiniana.AAC.1